MPPEVVSEVGGQVVQPGAAGPGLRPPGEGGLAGTLEGPVAVDHQPGGEAGAGEDRQGGHDGRAGRVHLAIRITLT